MTWLRWLLSGHREARLQGLTVDHHAARIAELYKRQDDWAKAFEREMAERFAAKDAIHQAERAKLNERLIALETAPKPQPENAKVEVEPANTWARQRRRAEEAVGV